MRPDFSKGIRKNLWTIHEINLSKARLLCQKILCKVRSKTSGSSQSKRGTPQSLQAHRGREILLLALILALIPKAWSLEKAIPGPPALPSFREAKKKPPPKNLKVTHITQRVPITAVRVGNTALRLKFKWLSQTRAALFKRSNRLMIAFERPALFDTTALSGQSSFFSFYESVKAQQGSVFIFHLKDNVEIAFEENHKSYHWTITLSRPKQEDATETPLPLPPEKVSLSPEETARPPAVGPWSRLEEGKALFDLKGNETPIFFKDPATEENLSVLPIEGALQKAQTYQEFTLLPSLKGLVFVSKSDALRFVKKKQTQISLASVQGALALSNPFDTKRERYRAPLPQLIHHDTWSEFPTDFESSRRLDQELLREINENPLQSQEKRLKRSYLLLFRHHSYEAAGELELMVARDPSLREDRQIALLEGIAYVLSHQPDRAFKYLKKPFLLDEGEAKLWAGLAHIQQERYHQGLKEAIPHLEKLSHYPEKVAQTSYFLMARAATQTNYPGKLFLDALKTENMTPQQRNWFDLLSAKMETAPDRQEHARKLYRKTLLGSNVRARIEAEVALAATVQEGKHASIDRLEHYRFRWRGDETELNLLRQLAHLYEKTGKVDKALVLYRQIKDFFYHFPKAKQEARRGETLFYNTFMKQTAPPHFEAVAFYDRFKELAPSDDRRFPLAQKLASDYEVLHLLPQAARTLEYLVQYQAPIGDVRGKILLQLVKLYRKDQKTEMVAKTLERLQEMTLESPELVQEYQIAQALFYGNSGKIREGLKLLEPNQSYKALRIKVYLAWKGEDWPLVTTFLRQLLAHKDTPASKQEKFLIKLAVSLHKQGDLKALSRLKESSLSLFQDQKKRQIFLLLTAQKPEIPEKPTYKELLDQLSAIEKFQKSLQEDKSASKVN